MSNHYIIVHDYDPDCTVPDCCAYTIPEWEIEHPDGCRTIVENLGYITYKIYTCPVGLEISMFGLMAFGSSSSDGWPEDLPKVPGKYAIEAWTEESVNYDRETEYDSGLRLVEFE